MADRGNLSAFAERRLGRIRIVAPMLRRDFSAVQRICAEIVPLRVEFMLTSDLLVIDAASVHFDVLPLGEEIPDYCAVVKGDGVEFRRQMPGG